MKTVASIISFDVQLSHEEMVAIRKMLSGNRVNFEVLNDARLEVKVQVEVKKEK